MMTEPVVPTRPMQLLAGLKILAFTHWLQGPSACQYLADLGADVVKIEPQTGSADRSVMAPGPGPDGASSLFVAGNRNTRSLALDLKSEPGREAVKRLLSEYDIVVENYRPGVLDRLGLGYEQLRVVNPALIFASATGYGPRGPLATMPGQDLLAQAMSGMIASAGSRPTPAGAAIVDQHGSTLLALAVLGAVVQRHRTGRGCRIEASLLNAALDLQMEALTFYLNDGREWWEAATRATELGTWYHQAPYGVYQVTDGWIAISITPMNILLDAIPELDGIDGLDPLADRDEIAGRLSAVLAGMTWTEADRRLSEAKVWHAPVLDYDDVFASEQVRLNGVIGRVSGAGWEASIVHHPVMYDGALPAVRSVHPRIGEHSRDVLRGVGYTTAEIDELVQSGVVSSPSGGVG